MNASLDLRHRGYSGTIEFSEPDNCYHGRISGIRDMITYEGSDLLELVDSFAGAVDQYIEVLERKG